MGTTEESAFATGSVRATLRLEGLSLLVVAVALYARSGAGWGMFAALLLVPDLSLAGYLAGPKIGARTYNAVHSEIGPLALGLTACLGLVPATLLPIALIWAAHVGMDRAFGYGLKYTSAFGDTHLGRVGKHSQPAIVPANAQAV
jgi:hypothetical protein